MAEHSARLARERSEDREMVRLTGQMTAQSAQTLQELAGAASTMLEKLDQRDEEAKHTTKVQLWIAVGSVIVSALLALVALVVSVAAYYQDKENISSGDKWQASVLGELKAANQQSSQAEASNRTLLQTVEQLRAKVSDLESRPPQAPTSTTKPQR
jgi:malonyl CoA-acyl carrier protein transacylase